MTKKEAKPKQSPKKQPTKSKRRPKELISSQGRSSEYTWEKAQLICERIATHVAGINTLCEMYDDMPTKETVYKWMFYNEEFADLYVKAKRQQTKIAMEGTEELYHSIKPVFDKEGNERLDAATVTHINNIVNNRKWMAARLSPNVYGKDTELQNVKAKSEEMEAKLKELLAKMDKDNEKDY